MNFDFSGNARETLYVLYKHCRELIEENDALWDEIRARGESAGGEGENETEVKSKGTYWENICGINKRQEEKGTKKYGQRLEENVTLTTEQRIEHLEEELIDGLKYCEHLKTAEKRNGMTANDYQRAAMRTVAAWEDKSEWLENAIYGIVGETGEIVDLVKKHKWQGHELDRENLILEAGDLLWYVALLASALDSTLDEIMRKNIDKLKARYPDGFSKERSVNREQTN